MALPQNSLDSAPAASLSLAESSPGSPECIVVLSATRQVLAVSGAPPPPLPTLTDAHLGCALDSIWPTLAPYVPASHVPDAPASAQGLLPVARSVHVPNAHPTGRSPTHTVWVQVQPLHAGPAADDRWLLRVRSLPLLPAQQVAQQRLLARGICSEPLERMASMFAHDLSNTFQALLGSLWLLQERGGTSGNERHLLSTIVAAAQQGVMQVRQQGEIFRRRGDALITLSRFLRDSDLVLRRLLGPESQLQLQTDGALDRCWINHAIGRLLFFSLFHFLGSSATNSVELHIRSQLELDASGTDPIARADGSSAAAATLALLFRSNVPTAVLPTEEDLGPPHTLWAADVLAQELGGSFRIDRTAPGISFELRMPLSIDGSVWPGWPQSA